MNTGFSGNCKKNYLLTNKKDELQNEATRAEEDSATTFAMEDADRHLARRKRQLRQQLERLKLQHQYLGGTITDRSNIPGHGGDDQSLKNDRHDYVEYEWGADDQNKMGKPTRGEQKI